MLVTLAEIRSHLKIIVTDTDHDSFLTHWILVVSSAIEEFCGRPFDSKNYTETFYRAEWGRRPLVLYYNPILTLDTIVSGDGQDLKSFYRLHKPSGVLDAMQTPPTWETLVVDYTAGFVNVPALVKEVVYSIVTEKFNRKQSGIEMSFGSDVQRVSIAGSLSVDFDYSLTANENSNDVGIILGNYKNALNPFIASRRVINQRKHFVE